MKILCIIICTTSMCMQRLLGTMVKNNIMTSQYLQNYQRIQLEFHISYNMIPLPNLKLLESFKNYSKLVILVSN